jgi:hypothetical protein
VILALAVLILVNIVFSSLNDSVIGNVLALVCLNICYWLFLGGKFLAKIIKITGFTVYLTIFMLLAALEQAAKVNGNPFLILGSILILGAYVFCAIIWGSSWLNNQAAKFEAKYGPELYQTDQAE